MDGRAWTMQELVLGGRVVRWEGWQVRWVCQGGEASENRPGMGEPDKGRRGVEWTRLLGDAVRGEEVDRAGLYAEWYRTVEQYTVRAITKQFDIMPAIGGLASRFQGLVGDRYVAGLWEGDLHQGLLWTVEGAIQPGEQRFRAPSWSWASINLTGIKFDRTALTGYEPWDKTWFEIEDVAATLASANAYGEVDGGVLNVTAYMRELRVAGASVTGKVYEYRKNSVLDAEAETSIGDIFLDYPRMSTDPPLNVWCVPVLHMAWDQGNLTSLCLALVPAGTGERPKFKRIGLAKVTNKKWDHGFFPAGGRRSICLI